MSSNLPARRRGPGKPFLPGQSGNPKGRPPGFARLIRERLGPNGEKLVDFLVSVLDGTATGQELAVCRELGPMPVEVGPTIRERLEAAKMLRDSGFGKPAVSLEISGPDGGPLELSAAQSRRIDPGQHTDAELEAAEASLAKLAELREREVLALPAVDVVEGEVLDATEEP